MQTSYLRGVLFCLVATVSWGCMFLVMTSALTQMDPFNFTAIRYTIAAIPFAVLLLAREGKGAFNLKGERNLLAWLFSTAGFAGFNFLFFPGTAAGRPDRRPQRGDHDRDNAAPGAAGELGDAGGSSAALSASSCSPLSASSW
jgi:drug/metabolite transporter (DMT)-like permease